MEQYTRNIHVQRMARYVDKKVRLHTKGTVDSHFIYSCFYFANKCKFEDQKTHKMAMLCRPVLRYLMMYVRSFCAKAGVEASVAQKLAKAVDEMYEFHPEWHQFQTRLSDSLFKCYEAMAKMKKIFINSAELYEDDRHPNAVELRRGVDGMIPMMRKILSFISIAQMRIRALDVEGLINRQYHEAEQRTEHWISVEVDLQTFATVVEQAHNAVVGRCCLHKFLKEFVEPVLL